jgi:hypothetical protein
MRVCLNKHSIPKPYGKKGHGEKSTHMTLAYTSANSEATNTKCLDFDLLDISVFRLHLPQPLL